MKIHRHLRGISFLLSFLMVVSLFTVCGFGALAENETKILPLKTFGAKELAAAATETGTKNTHDSPIFTTYSQSIGRRSISTANYFIFGANVPKIKNGEAQYYNGQSATMIVRLIAEDGYSEGNLCSFDVTFKANKYQNQYMTQFDVTWEEYDSTSLEHNDVYGYDYKEFYLSVNFEGDVFDEEVDGTDGELEMRVISRNNDYSTIVYGIEMIDLEDNVMAKYEDAQIADLKGIAGTYENIETDPENPAGIASYIGTDPGGQPNRTEPYNTYNADGQRDLGYPGTPLFDCLSMELPEGTYTVDFNMSSKYSCGVKKVTYYVMAGETELGKLFVDKNMVDATVGSDTGVFENRSVPFTVDADHAGPITFKAEVYNQTDYKLQSATVNLVVPADAEAPAEAKAVIDALTNLQINDAAGIAAARTAYDALEMLPKAWVNAEKTLVEKLASYEKAQTDAAALIAEITAVGNADDITWENYTTYTDKLAAAENSYKNFVNKYGEEDTAKLITNADNLTDLRSAYDAAETEAKEKEKAADIKTVTDLIDAIGPVTEENYESKKEPIEAAEAALSSLKSKYGDAVASDVTNLETLTKAREDYDKFNAEPEVLYGDVNNDQAVDATDALWVLQHSVELRTLTETELKAADVTDLGKVDTKDALQILQKTVELIDQFDVEKE